MGYTLERTLPNGTVKAWPTGLPTVHSAVTMVGRCLYDNCGASEAEAWRFSVDLAEAPLGQQLRHAPSGYAFRIILDQES